MKVQIIIDADVEDKDMTSKSPIIKLLKSLTKENQAQVKWYQENRERILAEDKARRAAYAREQYEKRKVKKTEEIKNIVVMPEPPADNILRFP
jgi:hypothetical protein